MPTLPSVAALAVLVVLSGIAGVVAADPTDVSTAAVAPTAVETGSGPVTDVARDRSPADDATFEERLAARLARYDLTDGQVRTVVVEAVRLRGAGASRLVIRSAIVMNLYEFGVDAPFLHAGDDATPGERLAGRLGDRFDLTDAQVAELAATVDRMVADGASRAEVYRAVRALLVEYGVGDDEVDAVDRRAKHDRAHRLHHAAAHDVDHDRDATVADRDAVDRRVDALGDRYDLTDGQAAEVERLVRGMLADGASREAIAEAVRDRLVDWGVEPGTDVRTPADEPADSAADRPADR